jgi:hypothetical protein
MKEIEEQNWMVIGSRTENRKMDSICPTQSEFQDLSYFFGGTTESLQLLATLNFTTVLAGILMAAPV